MRFRPSAVAFLLVGAALAEAATGEIRTLDSHRYHLRSGTNAEWEEFSVSQPFSRRLDISFDAVSNATEQTLFIWQDDVKQDWRIELNGKRLGSLFLMEAPLEFALRVPRGGLRKGSNTLSIVPPRENDDIRVGEIRLAARPLESALRECEAHIEVIDADSRQPTPCRITVTDANGTLAALFAPTNQPVAARPGVVYTGDGHATIWLRAGTYKLTATRGFEFSLDSTNVTVGASDRKSIRLQLRREVSTPGFVSCDTHVHTFTYSKHGDATVEERAITLAGEGIELPVATDHDIAVDLQQAAVTTHTRQYFTPVIGDEVTTRVGHFNIFPVTPGAQLPDNRETDWTTLLNSFRATPGVQVIVFNHPRNTHAGFQPFARTNWNRITGEARWPFDFRFDAMELMNSSAQQSDWTSVLNDWFALWNAGHFVTAVGSSDGHDVSRYIVGQGRTYIECYDAKIDAFDVNTACRNLKEGRAYVSMGLLPIITVNGRFSVGDLVTNLSPSLSVNVQARAPNWIDCQRIELFANGLLIAETNFPKGWRRTKPGIAGEVQWTIPRPQHDVFLVAVATGPGDTAPHWPVAKPYQPISPQWTSRVIGVANPVRIDADGDGRFTSAREYARTMAGQSGSVNRLLRNLSGFDEAIAVQTAAVAQEFGFDLRSAEFQRALADHPSIQHAFQKVFDEKR